ncbi:short-chain fatty acid transporter [Natronorubrum sediminis]|nr:TIGR00366 family protein [Natronorubrum sediminis]
MSDIQESSEAQMTPVQRFGEGIADRVERWMPSPFLFAILLTYVAAVIAFLSEGAGATEIALSWYGGFWDLLDFAMQMVLILVTAFVVAYHPWVKGVIDRIVRLPNNGKQAVVVVGVGAMMVGWISWGLGLIFGAILAREMGKYAEQNGMQLHYPLVAVAGYLGMSLTWGWGMSSSAGLLQATEGNVFMEQGVVDTVIPATEWVFHPYPLMLTVLAIVYASICLYLLTPPGEYARGMSQYLSREEMNDGEEESSDDSSADADGDADVAADGGSQQADLADKESPNEGDMRPEEESSAPADKINNSKVIGGVLALTGVALFVRAFFVQGLDALDLNVLNFGFIMVGLILYTSPIDYLEEFYDAVHSSSGIILQFPFYAGIIGIMEGTGLVDTMTEFLLSIATPATFPVIAWITAGILNVFVPSAGGEWTIVGGPMMSAGAELGIPHGQTIAAYGVGDAHTNLLNPFWAIPLLAITGLRARDMFGYAITMMILLTPFLAIALYVVPY